MKEIVVSQSEVKETIYELITYLKEDLNSLSQDKIRSMPITLRDIRIIYNNLAANVERYNSLEKEGKKTFTVISPSSVKDSV